MASHISAHNRENSSDVFIKPSVKPQPENPFNAFKARNALGDIGNRAGIKEMNKNIASKNQTMKPAALGLSKATSGAVLTKAKIGQLQSVSYTSSSIAGAKDNGSQSLLLQGKGSKDVKENVSILNPNVGITIPIPAAPLPKKLTASAASTRPVDATVLTDLDKVLASFSEQRLNDLPEDIDANDANNCILVSEYITEIMDYMFALEKEHAIEPKYLESRLINSRMRAVLMDWLVEVHSQYNFTAETLYLCNKLMDRFLSVDRYVSRQDLQLVGITSLLLAAKYEEVYVPSIRDFSVICDNAFTINQIRSMECRMMKTLSFDFSSPQPCFFLRRFSKAAKADVRLHAMAKYIMELSVVDYSVVDLLPSEIAAGSLAVALMILQKLPLVGVWNKTLEHYTRYSITAVRPLALKMAQVLARAHEEPSKLKAIKNKYAKGKGLLRISRSEELNVDKWKERVLKDLQQAGVHE